MCPAVKPRGIFIYAIGFFIKIKIGNSFVPQPLRCNRNPSKYNLVELLLDIRKN